MEVVDYTCPQCNKRFYQKRYLADHLRRTHKIKKDVANSKTNEENVSCQICDKKFASIKSESRHRLRIHGVHSENLKNTICCQEENCQENFFLLSSLRKHLEEKHGFNNRFEEKDFESFDGKC